MDYYSRLGINKNASQDEIKKAYRNLAKIHHPDRGGNQKLFQQINEAYDTLKDPQKKAAYDTPQPKQRQYNSQNMNDIFESMFRQQRQRPNMDVKLSINLTLEDVFTGKDLIASYNLRNGQPVDASIRIHAGVEHGEVIRYRGLGDNSFTNLPRGDLLIQIRVVPHKRFDRDGAHLYTNADVNVFDLMLGTIILVEGLNKNPIQVKIPPGTGATTILSVAGHGLPSTKRGKPGNLYIRIKGKVPKVTDPVLIERIQNIYDELSSRS
jgi:DnaJ-class molecular chaperone